MKQKYFIITVDTEGDNLWGYTEGEDISIRNAEYLSRFQTLCEKFCFKPVYLTNYEMSKSDSFIDKAKKWLSKDSCEIGVHLHAWNNPPLYNLQGSYQGNPYLIEYPEDVMFSKFKVIYDLIVENFGVKPVSHRAGRWAMDDRYFKILKKFGIKVDCSYTPGVNWLSSQGRNRGGSDYSKEINRVNFIDGVMEVPVSVVFTHYPFHGSLRERIRTLIKGENIWLRPASSTLDMMKRAINKLANDSTIDYIQFMLHSSELMPNGSPYFSTEQDVENEYKTMNSFFSYVHEMGYNGVTLGDYYSLFNKK